MKKLLIISPLFISIATAGQQNVIAKELTVQRTNASGSSGDSVLVKSTGGKIKARAQSDISGGGSTNTNIGTGIPIAVEGTNDIKKLRFPNSVTGDTNSTVNTLDIKLKGDSSAYINSPKVYGYQSGQLGMYDAIKTNITNISNTNTVEWDNTAQEFVTYTPYRVGVMQFVANITQYAPVTGDSTLTNTNFIGKYLRVFRNGKRLQTGVTYNGFEVDTSIGKVTFHPLFSGNDSVVIEAMPYRYFSTVTLQQPSIVWNDLAYPTVNGISQTSNVWTSSVSAWTGTGLSGTTLTANGSYRIRYTASDGYDCIIGFNASNTNESYSGYEYGVYLTSGGALSRVTNGVINSLGISISLGDYVQLNRNGSTFKIRTSTDGTNWTDRYTFAATSSATHYLNLNIFGTGKCYTPQFVNQ